MTPLSSSFEIITPRGDEVAALDEVYCAYAQRARRASGNLDRPAWMWRLRLEPKDKQPLRFLVVNDGRTEGYIVFTQGGRSDPLKRVIPTDLQTIPSAAAH